MLAVGCFPSSILHPRNILPLRCGNIRKYVETPGNAGNFFRNGPSSSHPLAPSGGEGQGEGVFRRASSIIGFRALATFRPFLTPHSVHFGLGHGARVETPLDLADHPSDPCHQPSSILHPRQVAVRKHPLPLLRNRTFADFCGLSAFFRRHLLHYADFQPLASQKPRLHRQLIPMVRNSGAARQGNTLYVGFGVRRIKPPFTRNTQHEIFPFPH